MNKFIYLTLSFLLLMVLGASWVIDKANSSRVLKKIKTVPNFSFINQNGQKFTNFNLKGNISIIDFMFTNCPGPCPIMANNMKELYDDHSKVHQVQFISITVDPNNDNIERLKQYSDSYGVNDLRWQFLTSQIDSIKDLKQNGFMLYADNLPQGHAVKFILVDHNGMIRQYYDGTDKASIAVLRKDIKLLLKELS